MRHRKLATSILLLAAAALAGCAGAPKTAPFVEPAAHPALVGGVRLLTEACVQRRVLVGANHFVLEASEVAAKTLDAHVRAHLQRRAVDAPGAPALSVCGVLNDPQDPQKTFAPVADGPIAKQAPPLKLSPALAAVAAPGLPPLLAELQLAAQRAAASKEVEVATLSPAARELAAAIAAPHEALLFVGLSGNSESGGKIAAQMTAIIGLSVAAAVAAPAGAVAFTGPSAAQIVASQAVTTVGVRFISIDGTLIVGALVDTKSGRIVWTNATVSPADPMRPEALVRGLTSERLLVTLLNRPVERWSPPGAAVAKAVP